jgi:hypothetical protein
VSFYSDSATVVNDSLREFGQAVTITTKSVGVYDPATGTATSTTTTQTAWAVSFPRSVKDIDGSMIKQGDQKLLLSMVGITAPTTDDTVTIGGIGYTITLIKSLSPAGIPMLCECNIRGA